MKFNLLSLVLGLSAAVILFGCDDSKPSSVKSTPSKSIANAKTPEVAKASEAFASNPTTKTTPAPKREKISNTAPSSDPDERGFLRISDDEFLMNPHRFELDLSELKEHVVSFYLDGVLFRRSTFSSAEGASDAVEQFTKSRNSDKYFRIRKYTSYFDSRSFTNETYSLLQIDMKVSLKDISNKMDSILKDPIPPESIRAVSGKLKSIAIRSELLQEDRPIIFIRATSEFLPGQNSVVEWYLNSKDTFTKITTDATHTKFKTFFIYSRSYATDPSGKLLEDELYRTKEMPKFENLEYEKRLNPFLDKAKFEVFLSTETDLSQNIRIAEFATEANQLRAAGWRVMGGRDIVDNLSSGIVWTWTDLIVKDPSDDVRLEFDGKAFSVQKIKGLETFHK